VKPNKRLERVCWDIAKGKPVAVLFLHALAIRLFLEFWSDELGPSYDQIKRALKDLRDAKAIQCRYPHGGFLHVALTPTAEPLLRAAFERRPIPSCKSALGSSCESALGDSANLHGATAQICTDTIDSGKETLGKEDSSSSSAPSVQGKGSKAKTGEGSEIRETIRKTILQMYADAGTQFHFTDQREGFLDRLAKHYGEEAPALLKAVADDWASFRTYLTYGKGNHTAAKKDPPTSFDLKWCCYTPEILRDWKAWLPQFNEHKADKLTPNKYLPDE
jgi:hypothetical protein